MIAYDGHVVGFCNTGCRDKFDAAIFHFEQAKGSAHRSVARRVRGSRFLVCYADMRHGSTEELSWPVCRAMGAK